MLGYVKTQYVTLMDSHVEQKAVIAQVFERKNADIVFYNCLTSYIWIIKHRINKCTSPAVTTVFFL